jgi:hypothetical protein
LTKNSYTVPVVIPGKANYQKVVGEAEIFPDGQARITLNTTAPGLETARALQREDIKALSIYFPGAKDAADLGE